MSARSRAKHKPGSFLGALIGLVSFSVIAGLLVSATLTPALAVASSTANSGLDIFENLPEYAQIDQQSERSTIYGMQNDQPVPIATFYSENRDVVSLADAGQWAPLAAIAGEDERFYQHAGVDAAGVARAVLGQLAGSDRGGASTLTMQLVRQQILMVACEVVDPATNARRDEQVCADQTAESYSRKLQEMKLAISLEQRYTKDEILLAYLNIANFGNATYGIQAAAQRTFNINANQLTVPQAASLISVLQNPSSLNLFEPDNFARNQVRRDYIIRNLAAEGYITEAQRDEALAIPVDANFVSIQPANSGCIAGYDSTRFFCDYVQEVLRQDQVDGHYIFGESAEANAQVLALGGLSIYTTIDVDLNDQVQATLDRFSPNTETRWESGSAVTMLEVGTGRILTMAQNRDFDDTDSADPVTETSLNYNVDASHGGGGGFQPGSGYKVFTLAAWIEAGYSVNTSLDTSRHNRRVPTCGASRPFDPQNNEGFQSQRQSVVGIFENSMNTGVVEMGTRLDVCDVLEVAERMGTAPAAGGSYMDEDNQAEWWNPPSLIGGTGNVTPMAMASGFQTIANGGAKCAPIAIDRIVGRDGAEVRPPQVTCEQAISPEVASVMQYTLQEVTGANPLNNPPGSAPVISKTGTNDNVVQTWVNGASSSVATSVWVGNVRGRVSLFNVGGRAQWNVRSSIFTNVMGAALQQYGGGAFPTPDADTLRGNAIELPNVAGQSPADARAALEGAGFAVTEGGTVAGAQQAGLVEYTAPGAGSAMLPGSAVTLFISDGSQAQPAATTIPDLAGQGLGDARNTVQSAGMDPAQLQITWQRAPGPQRCTVLAQNPAAGSESDAAAPISIVVGSQQDGEDSGC